MMKTILRECIRKYTQSPILNFVAMWYPVCCGLSFSKRNWSSFIFTRITIKKKFFKVTICRIGTVSNTQPGQPISRNCLNKPWQNLEYTTWVKETYCRNTTVPNVFTWFYFLPYFWVSSGIDYYAKLFWHYLHL